MATARIPESYFFFWKIQSPFSQWHPSEFTVEGIKYSCAEQYMMHQKAVLFGDDETAGEVLKTTDPRKMKALGRKVRNFDQTLWNDSCQDIVRRASLEKFSQNPHLKKELFKTEGKTLVEASPVDRIWGIGLAENNPKSRIKREWRGKNLLGYILTGVREELADLEAKSQSLEYMKGDSKSATEDDGSPITRELASSFTEEGEAMVPKTVSPVTDSPMGKHEIEKGTEVENKMKVFKSEKSSEEMEKDGETTVARKTTSIVTDSTTTNHVTSENERTEDLEEVNAKNKMKEIK